MAEKIDIKSMNQKELISFMEELGEKAFRAKQIYQWIHEKRVDSFDEMTNISKRFVSSYNNGTRTARWYSIVLKVHLSKRRWRFQIP